jgi:hypothetical protein
MSLGLNRVQTVKFWAKAVPLMAAVIITGFIVQAPFWVYFAIKQRTFRPNTW